MDFLPDSSYVVAYDYFDQSHICKLHNSIDFANSVVVPV